MSTPAQIASIVESLQHVWEANPHLTFGQMIERVENVAWTQLEKATFRSYSARWMNMPDAFLKGALDEIAAKGGKL